MTDRELAERTVQVNRVELAARAHMAESAGDEREAAQAVLRLAAPLRRALEQWIVTRATRAQREQPDEAALAAVTR